jgi:hypothetical protein
MPSHADSTIRYLHSTLNEDIRHSNRRGGLYYLVKEAAPHKMSGIVLGYGYRSNQMFATIMLRSKREIDESNQNDVKPSHSGDLA